MIPLKIYMPRTIMFEYVNHAGKSSTRRVRPEFIQYGVNDWHKDPQWIMEAYDMEKSAMRSFAMKDITNVRNIVPDQRGGDNAKGTNDRNMS